MMCDEDWVKAAMTDDSVVVEFLVRLHHYTPPPSDKYSHLALPLEWSVRQRRSKPIPNHEKNKDNSLPRASPTTQFSWSGATSVSDGSAVAAADGFEDSSLSFLKRTDAARSEVPATSETTSNKRTKKKKTLAELKEEELLLVKERKHLKRELATLRVTVEKQRAENEKNLKRLKIDLEAKPALKNVAKPNQTQQKQSPRDIIYPILTTEITTDHQETNISSQLQQLNQEKRVEIPDLNLPIDENFNSGGLI